MYYDEVGKSDFRKVASKKVVKYQIVELASANKFYRLGELLRPCYAITDYRPIARLNLKQILNFMLHFVGGCFHRFTKMHR